MPRPGSWSPCIRFCPISPTWPKPRFGGLNLSSPLTGVPALDRRQDPSLVRQYTERPDRQQPPPSRPQGAALRRAVSVALLRRYGLRSLLRFLSYFIRVVGAQRLLENPQSVRRKGLKLRKQCIICISDIQTIRQKVGGLNASEHEQGWQTWDRGYPGG